jgi:hypothetical protein
MEFATNLIPPSHYGDERCVNNILYRNAGLGPQPAGSARPQISFTWDATPGFGLFFHNDICADAPGAPVIFWIDAPRQKPPGKQDMTLREWQERYPRQAAGNIEADPQFVDPEKGDYHLQPTSPCIAAGGALTTVAADSGGTIVKVADALFFTDGYGIPGVEGDLLRLGARTARVVNVNYQTNELTVDQALTCQAGTPVNLSFVGSGPDIGAFQRK